MRRTHLDNGYACTPGSTVPLPTYYEEESNGGNGFKYFVGGFVVAGLLAWGTHSLLNKYDEVEKKDKPEVVDVAEADSNRGIIATITGGSNNIINIFGCKKEKLEDRISSVPIKRKKFGLKKKILSSDNNTLKSKVKPLDSPKKVVPVVNSSFDICGDQYVFFRNKTISPNIMVKGGEHNLYTFGTFMEQISRKGICGSCNDFAGFEDMLEYGVSKNLLTSKEEREGNRFLKKMEKYIFTSK